MKVHFIGIGGIGVSALAQYYLAEGAQVSGSDLVSSEITDFLKKKGIRVFIGHKKEHIKKALDLVIYSPAVSRDNPELKKALMFQVSCFRFHVMSYPQALGKLTREYFTIAVCGTHGKSTTTAMLAKILIEAGLNPFVIVGTKLKEFGNTNFRLGGVPKRDLGFEFSTSNIEHRTSNILLIEADEWGASFLNYWPKVIVLTNIEREHLDYYRNLENLLKAFQEFIGHLPEEGILIANRDDKNVLEALNVKVQRPNAKSMSKPKAQISNIRYFGLRQEEVKKLKEILKIPGTHNIYNALAALTCAKGLGIPDDISYKALSQYRGTWRRFEEGIVKIRNRSVILISDYAHHPTEVAACIEAVQEKYPGKKIWLIFQPHQYQRTYYLFDDFVKTLSRLDVARIIIPPIYDVVGREDVKVKKEVSSQKLVEALKKNKRQAVFLENFQSIRDYLDTNFGGDIIVVMGAGSIYKLLKFST